MQILLKEVLCFEAVSRNLLNYFKIVLTNKNLMQFGVCWLGESDGRTSSKRDINNVVAKDQFEHFSFLGFFYNEFSKWELRISMCFF